MEGLLLFALVLELSSPVWVTVIVAYFHNEGFPLWKCWVMASSALLAVTYLLATFVEYTLGNYFLILLAFLSFTITRAAPYGVFNLDAITDTQVTLRYWVVPPIILVFVPAILIFAFSRIPRRREDCTRDGVDLLGGMKPLFQWASVSLVIAVVFSGVFFFAPRPPFRLLSEKAIANLLRVDTTAAREGRYEVDCGGCDLGEFVKSLPPLREIKCDLWAISIGNDWDCYALFADDTRMYVNVVWWPIKYHIRINPVRDPATP